MRATRCISLCLFIIGVAHPALAAVLNVPASFTTIQAALDAAGPGDTVEVCEAGGPYFEKITFPASGSLVGGFISLRACAGERPVLDGTAVAGSDMVRIENRSFVRIEGFEIRNNLGVNDGSGVRVIGAGSHIEILDNQIHDMRGQHAMGITVYGTEPQPISDLLIDGNEIYDCEPFSSEALVVNANVTDFVVSNNLVRDVNNIGIDFIGGETDINPDPSLVARNGVCSGNTVLRARAPGEGYAGGIYVDGGRDLVIERNRVAECDLGIEIGAENAGTVTTNVLVRDNFVHANEKVGIVFGGYSAGVGRVRESAITNNTTYGNDTLGVGFGELWIQYADNNQVRNNLFVGSGAVPLTYSETGNSANTLDYNLWHVTGGAAEWVWRNVSYASYGAFQAGSGSDANGLMADPLLVDPANGDLHLEPGSPAINRGDPAFAVAAGELDFDSGERLNGARVDIGADETTVCGDDVVQAGEECDDGNLVDGDGCDSNCTATGCGNGVVTAGEQCDDGNAAAGDCCGAACQLEPLGSACSDGDACSNADQCDSSGACIGTAAPALVCKGSIAAGRSKLVLKDKTNDRGDRVLFGLTRGEATSPAELGEPDDTTDYDLCIYAGGESILAMPLPAGAEWAVTGSGYRYRDPERSPGGAQAAKLKAADQGRSVFKVKGKGENLAMPSLGLALPVVAQLRNRDGACWGASFSSPKRNDDTLFKAKSD